MVKEYICSGSHSGDLFGVEGEAASLFCGVPRRRGARVKAVNCYRDKLLQLDSIICIRKIVSCFKRFGNCSWVGPDRAENWAGEYKPFVFMCCLIINWILNIQIESYM